MRRRSFLRSASAATIGGFTVRGLGNPMLSPLFDRSGEDRVLVIVQLYGGNDGLNTVIPLDQYGVLSSVRSNVLIPESAVLDLPGITGTGLHPAMGGMRELWQNGKLSIVQGVGYPNPDFSHFRSTDIWETGADSDQQLASGWVGR
ncbi:MAG TPA: twin-arginine translocation pathway signal, partial [Flavobacteriales bacterium]|nr:twin-arginine translocation pathway signal [Flavobacteriales bacterium]